MFNYKSETVTVLKAVAHRQWKVQMTPGTSNNRKASGKPYRYLTKTGQV